MDKGWCQEGDGFFKHTDAWRGNCQGPVALFFVETSGPDTDRRPDEMPQVDLTLAMYVRLDLLPDELQVEVKRHIPAKDD